MQELKDFILELLGNLSNPEEKVSGQSNLDKAYQTEYVRGQREICNQSLLLIENEYKGDSKNLPVMFVSYRDKATKLRQRLAEIEQTEDVTIYGKAGNLNGQIDCLNEIRTAIQRIESGLSAMTEGSKLIAKRTAELAKQK